MSRLRADLLLLLAALIWGVGFYFQKTAMGHIGPFLFIGVRTILAVLAIAPFALREAAPAGEGWRGVARIGALSGVFFLGGAVLQQSGIVTASITNVSVLTSLYVVIAPFLVWMIERRRPPARIWAAASLAIVGIWALSGGGPLGLALGDALAALSAVVWAGHLLITHRATLRNQPWRFTCIQFLVVAGLALPLALLVENNSLAALWAARASVLYGGLLSTAVAFGLVAVALKHTLPTDAAVIMALEAVFAAGAGYLWLGERLGAVQWLGAALVLAGVLLVQWRPAQKAASAP